MSLSEEDKNVFAKFTAKMYSQLMKNVYKYHWRKCSTSYLEERLVHSVSCLMQAVNNNVDEIERRSADVANYSMMIGDKEKAKDEDELTVIKKCSYCGEMKEIPVSQQECYECWSVNTDKAFAK